MGGLVDPAPIILDRAGYFGNQFARRDIEIYVRSFAGSWHGLSPTVLAAMIAGSVDLPQIGSFERLAQDTNSMQQAHDSFVLYRIIGNDLYPLHARNQSYRNLQFVLENEPELPGCEKRWVVNRFVDKEQERAVVALLEKHRQQYRVIPFVEEDYRRIGFDLDCFTNPDFLASETFKALPALTRARAVVAAYRLKNNYVMNNNGARNAALREGRDRANWILPFDGNVFVTEAGWEAIRRDVLSSVQLQYFVVPMTWIESNSLLLDPGFVPNPIDEPQLLFRRDAAQEFDDRFPYGRRPKVEMFWRLGIPGDWDRWQDDPWDPARPTQLPIRVGTAGWVARMCSGLDATALEDTATFKERARFKSRVRLEAILSTLRCLDATINKASPQGAVDLLDPFAEEP